MPVFSPETLELLHSAGWFPGRQVETARYEQFLRGKTGPAPERVREFLSEFGGLHVNAGQDKDDLQVDPRLASEYFHIDEEGLSEYSAFVETPLCCVGVASQARILVLMDPAGRIFAAIDDLLYLAGNSPHAAIEALCGDQPLHELGSVDSEPV